MTAVFAEPPHLRPTGLSLVPSGSAGGLCGRLPHPGQQLTKFNDRDNLLAAAPGLRYSREDSFTLRGGHALKKIVYSLVLMLFVMSVSAFAADVTGFIADAKCGAKMGAKAASEKHANCAANCIKGGQKAVLVTEDGKVYAIANQEKVTDHAGHKVTVTGKVDGETITVDSVKM
jgi:hypothetical protein